MAQIGQFYGGWITNEIVGPFKGGSCTNAGEGSSVFNAFEMVSLGALVIHTRTMPDNKFDSTLAWGHVVGEQVFSFIGYRSAKTSAP